MQTSEHDLPRVPELPHRGAENAEDVPDDAGGFGAGAVQDRLEPVAPPMAFIRCMAIAAAIQFYESNRDQGKTVTAIQDKLRRGERLGPHEGMFLTYGR